MRYIEEISKRGRKGVFLLNLEYKRKSFDKSVSIGFKNALSDMQEKALKEIDVCSSINEMLAVKAQFGSDSLKSEMKKTYRLVGSSFANETYKNLTQNKKSSIEQMHTIWEQQMGEYVERYGAERIKLITNTTEELFKRTVKNITTQALNDGLSVQDAAKMIKDQIGFNNRYRALRIARTEIVSASNQGSLNGAKSTGLKLNKVWIATKGNRTRHSHQIMDGVTTGIDDRFEVPIFEGDKKTGSEKLIHPGDPNGSASNVINCRCTQGYKRIM